MLSSDPTLTDVDLHCRPTWGPTLWESGSWPGAPWLPGVFHTHDYEMRGVWNFWRLCRASRHVHGTGTPVTQNWWSGGSGIRAGQWSGASTLETCLVLLLTFTNRAMVLRSSSFLDNPIVGMISSIKEQRTSKLRAPLAMLMSETWSSTKSVFSGQVRMYQFQNSKSTHL